MGLDPISKMGSDPISGGLIRSAGSGPGRRVVADAEGPDPERGEEECEAERGRERVWQDIHTAKHDAHREVRDAPDRNHVNQKITEPSRVDVERILAGLDAAVRERVRDLQTL